MQERTMKIIITVLLSMILLLSSILPVIADNNSPTEINAIGDMVTERWFYSCFIKYENGDLDAVMSVDNTGTTKGYSVYVSRSTDNGSTWDNPRLLIPHGDDYGSFYASSIVTDNGTFLFYNRFYGDPNGVLKSNIYVMKSTDNGTTWQDEQEIATTANFSLTFNNGLVLRNGTLLKPYHYGNWYYSSGVLISTDNGTNWFEGGAIELEEVAGKGVFEPTVIERLDGSLYALLRTNLGVLYYSESYDKGLTWSYAKPTNIVSADAPAVMRRISFEPSVVLLSWNNNSEHRHPLCLTWSDDDGITWSDNVTIAQTNYDSDYPDICPLSGNTTIISWGDWLGENGLANGRGKAFIFDYNYLDAPLFTGYIEYPLPPDVVVDDSGEEDNIGGGGGGGGFDPTVTGEPINVIATSNPNMFIVIMRIDGIVFQRLMSKTEADKLTLLYSSSENTTAIEQEETPIPEVISDTVDNYILDPDVGTVKGWWWWDYDEWLTTTPTGV